MKSKFYVVLTFTCIGVFVIGLGLGYYYQQTKSSKEIIKYRDEIMLLNESLNDQELIMLELNATADELEKINFDLMDDLKNKSDKIIYYEGLLDNYKKFDVPYGYQNICLFGFNIPIPNNSTVTLNGLYESRASNDSGILHVMGNDGSTRVFFSWENSEFAPPLDAKLDEARSFYTYMMINGSNRFQEKIKNYEIKYDLFNIEDVDEVRQVIIASWLSANKSRLYYLDIQINDDSVVDFFNLLINYFNEING